MASPERYTRDAAQITLSVNGQAYVGWLQSEVSRDLESISATFSVPISLPAGFVPPIKRQDLVRVEIGKTLVCTGYVLAAQAFYNARDCGVVIMGRDRTGDLIRASAIHAGGQWRNVGLDRICRDILAPFGLELVVEADIGAPVVDFKLAHGETALDALARAAKLRGVILSRDAAGRVVLAKAGKKKFKGTIRRGWNVIEMRDIGTDEQRHSEYIVYGQSHTVASFEAARGLKAKAVDAEMQRYSPLIINAQGNTTQAELQALADHTARVRRGHSMGFAYTVEGWTFEGEAWPLNERVAIYDDVAGLAGDEWLITSVRQTCSLQNGDVTELVVRPVEAYDSVPLKSKPVRRNWGNKGNTTNHDNRGPNDGARS
jgi:prophage tail gpP-like protein